MCVMLQSSLQDSSGSSGTGTDSGGTTPSPSYALPPSSTSASTWANWPDPPCYSGGKQPPDANGIASRPHTISTAYEKSSNRPMLTSETFEPPTSLDEAQTTPSTPNPYAVPCVMPAVHSAPALSQYSCLVKQPGMARPPSLPPPPLGPKPPSRAKPVAPPTIPNLEGENRKRFSGEKKKSHQGHGLP